MAPPNKKAEPLDERHSLTSEDESDLEDEVPRTSEEVRRHDQETLTAEEEAERLLVGDEKGHSDRALRRENKKRNRSIRKARRKERWREEEGELMYKVEEGGRNSSSSAESSEVDLRKLSGVHAKRKGKKSRVASCCKFTLIFLFIIVALIAFLLGAYRATKSSTQTARPSLARVLSNGTHDFAPTTILISLDGFRADFVYRGLTPTLTSFIKQGVSPKYMLPSFPSLTFPNHFTLVTGLYPQDHGIVGNTFWDPNMEEEFYYTDPARSMRPEFWNAEPIWETAELQGIRSAIHMWPGSEAHIGDKDPAYVDKFNGQEHLDVKVRRILGWLDMPGEHDLGTSVKTPRPQLIAAYVPNVDSDGHKYGPNSTYIRSTIAEVDGMLGSLFSGIEERNLTDIVNVVIVSDHGMATTSNHRLVQLEDLVDTSLIEHIDGWPLYGLRPFDQSEEQLQIIYRQLVAKSQLPEHKGHFDVYLRDENMPERYHFSKNDRIAPLWIVPKAGWAIVTKDEFNVETALEQDLVYSPRGLHGYDHEHPLMRAIFIARGPAFPHPQGSQVEPFQNIELYNIICDSLGLEPRPNNGTIRLPFKPSGLHDLTVFPEVVEEPEDLDTTSSQIMPPTLPGIENLPPVPSLAAEETSKETIPEPVPEPEKDEEEDLEHASKWSQWLEWVSTKWDDTKDWVGGLFGDKGDSTSAEDIRHGDDWKV